MFCTWLVVLQVMAGDKTATNIFILVVLVAFSKVEPFGGV